MSTDAHGRLFHRFPFRLFDRPLSLAEGEASAARLISFDDALHEGRAGGSLAQALLLEAMAQTAALFAESPGGTRSGWLAGLRRIRFGRAPRAGDRLLVEARFVQRFGDVVRVEGRVSESGEALAEGEILISLAGAGDARGTAGPPAEGV